MGLLQIDDEDLHYSDASHRWVAASDAEQDAWTARLKAHLAAHARGDSPRGPLRRLGE